MKKLRFRTNRSPHPISRVYAALRARGLRMRPEAVQFRVGCPAHHDEHTSLSVVAVPDGTVLLKCGVGCPIQSVLERLGLTVDDLFPTWPSR